MTNRNALLGLAFVFVIALAGCGNGQNYDRAKQQTDEETKEYLLQVSGMT